MRFKPELSCYQILLANHDGVVGTEDCDCAKHIRIPNGRRTLVCKNCRREYDPRTKTAFDRSRIDLAIWFYAIDRWNGDLNYNAHRLSNETGIMYSTAQRVMGIVSQYIWHETKYYPLSRCEVVVKKERRAVKMNGEEFRRPGRKYKRRVHAQ